jgi:hypothetical protein
MDSNRLVRTQTDLNGLERTQMYLYQTILVKEYFIGFLVQLLWTDS